MSETDDTMSEPARPEGAARRRGRGCAAHHARRACATSATRSREFAVGVAGGGRGDRRATTRTCRSSSCYQDDEHALDLIEEIIEYARGPVIAMRRAARTRSSSRGRRARHLRVRARGAGRVDPGGDRGRDAPPRRASASWREQVERLETRARAPRADRAGEGDPHGAPRHRRARGVRAAARATPAAATAPSSTCRRRSPKGTRCCRKARD